MAWTFTKNDIPLITAVASVHPDPVQWWTLVETDAVDTDVEALATAILAAYAAQGTDLSADAEAVVEQLKRIGDTDPSLELTRVDTTGTGETVEIQAKARGWIG